MTEGDYLTVSNKEKLQLAVSILENVLHDEKYGVPEGSLAPAFKNLDEALKRCCGLCSEALKKERGE